MKSYLITDPKLYSNVSYELAKRLESVFSSHRVYFAQFRDKESENFEALAKVFLETCNKNGIKNSFLNSNFKLAYKLGFFGVHLTSRQFGDIKKAKDLGLKVIISTHEVSEVKKAKELEADFVTFSPIFHSPNKGKPKGLLALKEIIDTIDINIFALGGIVTKEHIDKIKSVGAYGFASIRYFTKGIE